MAQVFVRVHWPQDPAESAKAGEVSNGAERAVLPHSLESVVTNAVGAVCRGPYSDLVGDDVGLWVFRCCLDCGKVFQSCALRWLF